jgi:hypothetical protein
VEIKNSPDSKSADALADVLKDSVFTIMLDSSGRITKFEGYDALLAKFGKLNESTSRIVRATVPEESFKDPLAELFSFGPEKAVKPGESWQRDMGELAISMGPLGGFKSQNKYTDAGKGSAEADRKLSMVDLVSTVTYAPPRPSDEPFPFKILGGNLKVESAKGSIAFDAENGRVVRLKFTMKIAGDLKIEIAGQESKCTIERQQTLRMQVLDKAPEKN